MRDWAKRLTRRLSQQGFQFQVAASPSRAARLLRKRLHQVIVVDLPRSGEFPPDFLKSACADDRDLAVIVLAKQPSLESVVKSFQNGVADYLVKPVTEEKLVQALLAVAIRKGLLRPSPKSIISTVGERLRRRRQSLSLSLRQLSRRTGLSVSMLSQIELARSSASIDTLHKICTALAISLSFLFEGI